MNVVFRSIASRFVFQRECAESIDFFFTGSREVSLLGLILKIISPFVLLSLIRKFRSSFELFF